MAPSEHRERRLVAAWTLAAWAQVVLPGLYWPHYYLLPIAGAAIAVAVCLGDAAAVLGIARCDSAKSDASPGSNQGPLEPRQIVRVASDRSGDV